MSSQTGARLVYANAKNTLIRHNLNPAKAVLSQSYLRFEAALSTTTTQFNFDVLVNDNLNSPYVTQNKLNLQDSFIASSIGVYIGIPASGSTNVITEGRVKLYSYPDVTQFTATTATALQTLYSGFLSLTVNQRVIVPSWDLMRHYTAPIIQSGFVPAPITAGNIQNSEDLSNDGMFTVEPNMVFVGSKKNQLTITLPQALSAIPANGRVVVIARGLLAQNCTSVR
jgi:hypothetical protein